MVGSFTAGFRGVMVSADFEASDPSSRFDEILESLNVIARSIKMCANPFVLPWLKRSHKYGWFAFLPWELLRVLMGLHPTSEQVPFLLTNTASLPCRKQTSEFYNDYS